MADWGLRIGIEGEKDFQTACREISNQVKNMNSTLDLAGVQFGNLGADLATLANSVNLSGDDLRTWIDTIRNIRDNLENQKTALQESIAEHIKLATELSKEQAEINAVTTSYEDNRKALEDNTNALQEQYAADRAVSEGLAAKEHLLKGQQQELSSTVEYLKAFEDAVNGNTNALAEDSVALDKADGVLSKYGLQNASVEMQILELEGALQNLGGRLDNTTSNLNDALGATDKSSKAYQNSLYALEDLDHEYYRSATRLIDVNAGLDEHTKAATADQKTLDYLEKNTARFNKSLNESEKQIIETAREMGEFNDIGVRNSTSFSELGKVLSGAFKTALNTSKDRVDDLKDSFSSGTAILDKFADGIGSRVTEALDHGKTSFADLGKAILGVGEYADDTSEDVEDTGETAKSAGEKGESGFGKFAERIKEVTDMVTANIITAALKEILDLCVELGKVTLKGIVDGLTAATEASIAFESSFADVQKTLLNADGVGATEEQLAAVSGQLRTLSTEIPVPIEELNKLAGLAGQFGIIDTEVASFTKTVAGLGESTNLSSEDASQLMAQFGNITGLELTGDNFARLGSTLVALGNTLPTTEADIMEMANRLAGVGAQVKMSEADILAFSAGLSSVGINAESGGTAISKAFTKMQAATTMGFTQMNDITSQTGLSLRDLQLLMANNSKGFKELAQSLGLTSTELKNTVTAGSQLEDFSRIAGMAAEDLVTAFEDDAAGAMRAFMSGLGDVDDAGESTLAMLTEMGLSEVRIRDNLVRAANASEMFGKAGETATLAWEENVALTNEVARRYDTLESRQQLLTNATNDLAVSVGDKLNPVLKDGTGIAADFMSAISTAFQSGDMTEFGKQITAITAELPAFAANIESTAEELTASFTQMIPQIIPIITELTQALLPAIINAIPTILDGAGQIIQAFAQGIVENKDVIVTSFTSAISSLAGIVGELLGVLIPLAGEIIIALGGALGSQMPTLIRTLMQAFTQLFTTLTESLTADSESTGTSIITEIINAITENLPALIDAGILLLQALVDGLVANLPVIIPAIITLMLSLVSALIENLPAIVDGALQIIMALAQGLLDSLPVLVENLPKIINGIVGFITENLPDIVDAAITIMLALADGILESLPEIIEVLPDLINGLVEALDKLSPLLIDAGIMLLSALVEDLPKILAALGEVLPSLIMGIVNFLMTQTSVIAKGGVKLITALIKDIPAIIGGIVKMLPTIIQGIVTGILTNLPAIIQAGISLLTSLVTAMPEIVTAVLDAVMGLIGDVIDWIKNGGISDMIAAGKDFLKGLLTGIGEVAETVWSGIKSFFTDTVLGGIKNIFGIAYNGATALKDIGTKMLNGFLQGFNTVVETVWTAIKSFFSDTLLGGIKNLLGIGDEDATTFFDIGVNLIKGLWNGIESVGEWIWSKIEGFCDGITDAVLDFFGIKSPSRLFRDEVGKNLALGIGEGFGDELTDVTKGVVADTDKMTTALTKALPSELGSGFSLGATVGYDLAGLNQSISAATVPINTSLSNDLNNSLGSPLQVVIARLDGLTNLMSRLIQVSGFDVVLDTGVMVGSLVKPMNTALNDLQRMGARA